MPNPVGLKTVRLHGRYVEPNVAATPLQGTVSFTPAPSPITFPNENVIVQGTEVATLDSNGEFTIELICTDTAGQNPTGWTYTVSEKVLNQKPRSYQILLPYTDTSVNPVELADITPTDSAPTYLPVTGPQGPPGVIQTVNGKTGISITLNASDVSAIATSAAGAANGVATLDSSTKIPVAQIPNLSSTYVAVTQLGAASGVATLDSTGKHTVAQYNFSASAPPSVASTGAVGTSTSPARSDHTHAGVDLSSNQSAAGNKTWTGDGYFNGGRLGVNSGTSLSARVTATSSVDENTVNVVQSNASATKSLVLVSAASASTPSWTTQVTGDTNGRYQVFPDGQVKWGPGNSATDVTLYRSGVGALASSGTLAVATPVGTSDATTKSYVDGAGTFTGSKTFSGGANFSAGTLTVGVSPTFSGGANFSAGTLTFGVAPSFNAGATFSTTAPSSTVAFNYTAATGTALVTTKITADTQPRFAAYSDGSLNWGPGNAVVDTTLSRIGSANLGMTGRLSLSRAAATNPAASYLVTGDTVDRLQITADGKHSWGPGGSTATDTTLYRNSAGELKTDGNLTVLGNIVVSGIGGIAAVWKSAATSRASTTTLTADPHLTIALAANARYLIDAYLTYDGPASAADVKIDWTVPSGATMKYAPHSATPGANANAIDTLEKSAGTPYALGTYGAGAGVTANLRGYVTTGGTSGNLTLTWSQNTSNASNTTMYANSWLKITRVA